MSNFSLIILALAAFYAAFTAGRAYQTDYIRHHPTATANIICGVAK